MEIEQLKCSDPGLDQLNLAWHSKTRRLDHAAEAYEGNSQTAGSRSFLLGSDECLSGNTNGNGRYARERLWRDEEKASRVWPRECRFSASSQSLVVQNVSPHTSSSLIYPLQLEQDPINGLTWRNTSRDLSYVSKAKQGCCSLGKRVADYDSENKKFTTFFGWLVFWCTVCFYFLLFRP